MNMKIEKRRVFSHVFEHHAVVDEEDTLALEEFPHCLAPLPLCVGDADWWRLLVRAGDQVRPMDDLQSEQSDADWWILLACAGDKSLPIDT